MKKGERARSENFEQVTLMHCDITQFSDLALESSALETVEMLNELSDFYDAVIEQHDAYKMDSNKDVTVVSMTQSCRKWVRRLHPQYWECPLLCNNLFL